LYDNGKFIEKSSEQYYDEENNQFLADRYITGTCPNVGSNALTATNAKDADLTQPGPN
jgi:methionyl-tRNA synthetase